VRSVASFFVSRIDTKADAALRKKVAETSDPAARAELESLLGNVAIANAKLAYQRFLSTFSGPRWQALAAKGARVQRPLWASTGTKDPAYSDILYIDSLIGPDTVNTIPPKTYEAFKDHGTVRATLTEGANEARAQLDRLERAGISLDDITRELTVEGVKAFSASFESLMNTIESRRAAVGPASAGKAAGR
ncbi:MAG TPA: transaldolase family protein, partial [Thermoanaerobaculia bacterium]